MAAALLAFVQLAAEAAKGQSSVSAYEIGGQLSGIDMRRSLYEKPPGIGGRFSYNITDHLAIDTALTYFSTPEADLNRTQGLFGAKAGKRFASHSFGLFAKARPGFMRFHGDRRPGVSVDGTTRFVLDAGGVLEFYPSGRFIVRIDVGDSIIFYNGEVIRQLSLPGGPQKQLGTSHNLQFSVGAGFHF